MTYPRTIEEARAFRYGRWAGNPEGREWAPGWCAAPTSPAGKRFDERQCRHRPGYGPAGLYCKRHGRIEDERAGR